MDFSQKKLQPESINELEQVPVESIKPFVPVFAPVYVYLRENAKLISIKAPLDFFTEKELAKFNSHKNLYFFNFKESTDLFKQAGEQARSLLTEPAEKNLLEKAVYEVSDETLKIIGALWWEYSGKIPGIEPFFIAVFITALCDPLPPQDLLKAREEYASQMDLALFRSSWAVFLALHLGYCDLGFLNELRMRTFRENIYGIPADHIVRNEVDELIQFAYDTLRSTELKLIGADLFKRRKERISHKLEARLERVKKELMSQGKNPPTIFGKRGFIDV